MPPTYDDLGRPSLRAADLRRGLVSVDGLWTDVRVVERTGSTNSDVAVAARAGAPEGLVVVAEEQSAGRGRLERPWTAPPRSSLLVSVLLRPAGVPVPVWGWLPLLAGVAVVSAVGRVAQVDPRLKWPNDLLLGERKLGGILAERVEDAVVVGLGLNVSLRADELPAAAATSLALEGALCTDRDPLLRAVLRELERWYADWRRHGGDPHASGLHVAYSRACGTLGREVSVDLPGGARLTGTAREVDAEGRLVVSSDDGTRAVGAGDVVHVR